MSLYLPRLEHGELKRTTTTFGLPLGHLAPVAPVHVASEFTVGVSFFQGSRLEKKIVDPLMFKFPILWFNFNSTLLYSHCSIFSFLLSKDAALTQPFYAVTALLQENFGIRDPTLPGLYCHNAFVVTLVKEWALPPGPTTRMAIRHALLFSAEVEEAGPKISWIDPTPVKVKQSEFSDKILKV